MFLVFVRSVIEADISAYCFHARILYKVEKLEKPIETASFPFFFALATLRGKKKNVVNYSI